MMRWEKQGLVYGSSGDLTWAAHSALQPTPLRRDQDVLRIFAGFRDENGSSRIGYVDVDEKHPLRVIGVSPKPLLDVGSPGAFDEHGVVPCAAVRRGDDIYLYYAGYQLGHGVRFTAFGGLAVSKDNGETFVRHSRAPLTDRTDKELLFRAIHSVLFEDGIWKVWYGGGDEFVAYEGKSLPVYDIRYMESPDGVSFGEDWQLCLPNEGDEHRVGRPFVVREKDRYRMFYAAGSKSRGFRLGYAESVDGKIWKRMDDEMGIELSPSGWDAQMMAYPSVYRGSTGTWLFYNGNNYGRDGFGVARLISGW